MCFIYLYVAKNDELANQRSQSQSQSQGPEASEVSQQHQINDQQAVNQPSDPKQQSSQPSQQSRQSQPQSQSQSQSQHSQQPFKSNSKTTLKRKKKSFLSSFFSAFVPCVGESSKKSHDINEISEIKPKKSMEQTTRRKSKDSIKQQQQPISQQNNQQHQNHSQQQEPNDNNNQNSKDNSNEDNAPPTPVIPSSGVDLPISDTAGLTSGAVMPPGKESIVPPTPSRQHSQMSHENESSEDEEEEYEDEYEDEIAYEERIIAKGGMGIPIGEDGEPKPLLPSLVETESDKKCLVLDLDETLVHSSFKLIQQADYVVPVEIESQTHNVYVIKRPGVDAFLKRMGELYEIVVFTASLAKYADPVLDMLDINKVVKHRLFRESCYNHKGNYVKDLSQLGRLISQTIIIDNSPASYVFHPNNAVPVSSWFNDPHDTELTDLCPFLSDLTSVDDVRGVLDGSLNEN